MRCNTDTNCEADDKPKQNQQDDNLGDKSLPLCQALPPTCVFLGHASLRLCPIPYIEHSGVIASSFLLWHTCADWSQGLSGASFEVFDTDVDGRSLLRVARGTRRVVLVEVKWACDVGLRTWVEL